MSVAWELLDVFSPAAKRYPMAVYCGVTAIPATILVDRDGEVVSLNAKGQKLDQMFEELLGPVEKAVVLGRIGAGGIPSHR